MDHLGISAQLSSQNILLSIDTPNKQTSMIAFKGVIFYAVDKQVGRPLPREHLSVGPIFGNYQLVRAPTPAQPEDMHCTVFMTPL